MKISELIAELQSLQAAHGDIPVKAYNAWDILEPVSSWYDSDNECVRVEG